MRRIATLLAGAVSLFLLLTTYPLQRTTVFGAVEMPGVEHLKGLTWLGHASFKLVRGDVTVYFDPWRIEGEPHDGDLVLVSHPHFDHCDAGDVAKVARADAVILTVADCAEKLKGSKVSEMVQVVQPGDTAKTKGIQVEVVPAYNTNKDFHLKESDWAGFIVELDGLRFYHAGDTDFIPEMRGMKVDVALLPVSGIYVMNAQEAAQAAKAIAPKVAVPMHYGSIVGSAADAKRFQELASGILVEILQKESSSIEDRGQ